MKRKFTKYPQNYVRASYIEPTGKPTLSGVRACFYGVPNDLYTVTKQDDKILVVVDNKIHTYWYAMKKLFQQYEVVEQSALSNVYEVISVKN